MTRAKVGIIDYGAGNIASVVNMLKHIGVPAVVCRTPTEADEASALIVPGVGSFAVGMDNLNRSGLADAVRRAASDGRHVLGICLGMQLLVDYGDEGGASGLGLIPGRAEAFDRSRFPARLPVPHMGWNTIRSHGAAAEAVAADLPPEPKFYFVHGYHVVCDEPDHVFFTTRYGYEFASGIGKDNVLGVQFHPEKSHKYGMRFLSSFVRKAGV